LVILDKIFRFVVLALIFERDFVRIYIIININ